MGDAGCERRRLSTPAVRQPSVGTPTMLGPVTRANVGGAVLGLRGADDENKVVLRDAGVPDLLHQGGALVPVHLGGVVCQVEPVGHRLGVPEELGVDGDDEGLARREPKRPLAAEVFAEDGKHPLNRAQDGTVDDDRAVLRGQGGGQRRGRQERRESKGEERPTDQNLHGWKPCILHDLPPPRGAQTPLTSLPSSFSAGW